MAEMSDAELAMEHRNICWELKDISIRLAMLMGYMREGK